MANVDTEVTEAAIEYKPESSNSRADRQELQIPDNVKINLATPPKPSRGIKEDDIINYYIGDQEWYINKFIGDLRAELTKGNDDIFYYNPKKGRVRDEKDSRRAHPLLVEQLHGNDRLNWFIYIKIIIAVEEAGRQVAPVLAIRKNDVYIMGFRNKKNQWFEVPEKGKSGGQPQLGGLDATMLTGWDDSYAGTMNLKHTYQVNNTLKSARFGRAFAVRALRRLWDYDHANPENEDGNPTRHGLAGLYVMISEAARMKPFLHTIAGGWNGETGLTEELVAIKTEWATMSAALLQWRDSAYRAWPKKCERSQGYALATIHLVRFGSNVIAHSKASSWVEILAFSTGFPVQGITIIDDKGDSKFDKHQDNQEDCPSPPGNHAINACIQKMDLKHGICCVRGSRWSCITQESADSSIPWEFSMSPPRKNDGGSTFPMTTGFGFKDNKGVEKNVKATYLVMSDAVEAIVNVNVRCPMDDNGLHEIGKGSDGDSGEEEPKKYTVKGEIFAYIGEYSDPDYNIRLFSSPDGETSEGKLKLQRENLVVPRRTKLHIVLKKLVICDDDSNKEEADCTLNFNYLDTSPSNNKDGPKNIRVDISWDHTERPEVETNKKPLEWNIGDDSCNRFAELINKLRYENIFAGSKQADIGKYKVRLVGPVRPLQDRQWTHIEVKLEGEKSSITLAIRDDIIYVDGFKNQAGVWYSRTSGALGPKYNSVDLHWGSIYGGLLRPVTGVRLGDPAGDFKLKNVIKTLGKDFAVQAVRTLSRYPDVGKGDLNPRLALGGLMIMLSESAIWDSVFEYLQTPDVWNRKVPSTTTKAEEEEKKKKMEAEEEKKKKEEEVMEEEDKLVRYIYSWDMVLHRAMLKRDNASPKWWPTDKQLKKLERLGFKEEDHEKLLDDVRLVYNSGGPSQGTESVVVAS